MAGNDIKALDDLSEVLQRLRLTCHQIDFSETDRFQFFHDRFCVNGMRNKVSRHRLARFRAQGGGDYPQLRQMMVSRA